jgi:hypothetical protein
MAAGWHEETGGVPMSSKPPPVPPANQSTKGPGNAEAAPKEIGTAAPNNPDKTGQQGNTKINTTHSGHQQDW